MNLISCNDSKPSGTFDKAYLVKNSTITTFCRGVGVATGLLLDAVIMGIFGLVSDVDAFFAAMALPLLISSALGTQFAQVLVPLLARIDKESGRARTSQFLNNVLTTWVVFGVLASLLGMLMAGTLMPLQIPGFKADATLLSVRISMMLVWLILIRGIGDILSCVLYAFHKYWLASLSRAMVNVCTIITLLVLQKQLGIYALAVSFLAGAASQCVVLWLAVRRLGFAFRPVVRIADPELQMLSRLMIYPSAGQMLSEFRTVLENYFASYYAAGVLSGLKYATRMITAISSIMMGGVVTATLPMVSHNMAENQVEEMKRNILRAMKLLLLLALPISAWLIFNGGAVVSILFERGKFLKSDGVLIARFLALMTPYILFGRVVSLIQIPFYAGMNTKTPLVGMIISFLLYLIFTPVLVYGCGIYGFPLSTSLTAICASVVMAVLMRRCFGPVGWGGLRDFSTKLLLAVFASCGGFLLGRVLMPAFDSRTLAVKMLALAVPSAVGLGGFLIIAQVIGFLDSAKMLRRLRRLSAEKFDSLTSGARPS